MVTKYFIRAIKYIWERGTWWLILTIIFNIILGLIPIAIIWVSKELINSVADLIQKQHSNYYYALMLLLLQFGIVIFQSLLRNFQTYINRRFEINLEHDLQESISIKSTSAPLKYFDMPEFYNHLNRIELNPGQKLLTPIRALIDVGRGVITVSSYLVFLFTIHWSLILLSTLISIPILIVHSKYGRKRFELLLFQTPENREARYITYLLKNREVAKEIRVFGLAEYLINRWSIKYNKMANESLNLLKKNQVANVSLDALSGIFYVISAGIIIWLIRIKPIQIGDFVAISQAVQGTQATIKEISTNFAKVYEENLYIKDLFDFLDYEFPDNNNSIYKKPFPYPLNEGIKFENVSFKYIGSERVVLKNINFEIKPGEKVVLVGENGSGKTTLVKCLMGLYSVSEGSILIDSVNITDIDKVELRKSITTIFQDYMRYSFSIKDNIGFGNIEKINNKSEIINVSKKSGVDDFVKYLDEEYETYLGRNLYEGVDLSGGQWQKIALARALFGDGQIIILDEPTSALDPIAEREVFKQFEELTKDKTAIFISHRLSVAKSADKILVMKDGQIIEIGNHEQLMDIKGEYYKMFKAQSHSYTVNNKFVSEVV